MKALVISNKKSKTVAKTAIVALKDIISLVNTIEVPDKFGQEFVTDIKKSINKTDFIVVDITEESREMEYIISYANDAKKPVFIMYNTKTAKSFPNFIKHLAETSKLLEFGEYINVKELKENLKAYIKKLKSLIDSKFILIISSEIDRYLEWSSSQKRMHKAQVVRAAIEEMINKDKEWVDSDKN